VAVIPETLNRSRQDRDLGTAGRAHGRKNSSVALAASLGWAKQMTGSYQSGLLAFAALALIALVCLTGVKSRWRRTWSAAAGAPLRL
jgi:nitrate/nitrite transporter NarK